MIDISIWRARIGLFSSATHIPLTTSNQQINFDGNSFANVIFMAVVILVLIMIAGDVEVNPGPLSKEDIEKLHTLSHDELKEKGNTCINKKEYDDAISFYSIALEKNPNSHTVFSNRSLAHSKKGDYEQALSDAQACLKISPKFARGYLRKCVALIGLKLYQEAMEAAQDGYKLRGSNTICRDCISQWITACKKLYREMIDQRTAEIGFDLPKQFLVTSESYYFIYLTALYGRLGLTDVDMSFIKGSISSGLDELDRVLQLFGHSLNSLGHEWCDALCESSKINPKTGRVPNDICKNLLEKSIAFSSWLNSDIDPVLFPIISPIISLILMTVGVHYISLNGQNTDQHVTQIQCRSCLIFLDTPFLSGDIHLDYKIAVYKELLEALATSPFMFTVDEMQFIYQSIERTEALIKECPKNEQTEEICDKAMVSIGLIRIRLNEEPGFDITAYAKDSGKAVSKTAKDDPETLKAYVADKQDFLRQLMNQPERFAPALSTEVLDLFDCVGALIDINEMDKAVEIFTECEMGYVRLLHEQLGKASFTLDEAPSAFNAAQGVIFPAMAKFVGKEDWLIANTTLRWKCIYSEFRVFLIRLGVGQRYLKTFQAIQEVQIQAGQEEHVHTNIAEEHQQEIKTVIKEKGQNILLALMTQSEKDIKCIIHPGQIILDFLFQTTREPTGQLIVWQPNGKVNVYTIITPDVIEHTKEWVHLVSNLKEEEAKAMSRKLCQLLLPQTVQDMLSSPEIQYVYICPDWTLGVLPLELLEFSDGHLFADKCCISYLSSPRELLRRSSLETLLTTDINGDETLQQEQDQCIIVADPAYDLKAEVGKGDTNWKSVITTVFESLFGAPSEKINLFDPIINSKEEAHDIERVIASIDNEHSPITTHCLMCEDAILLNVIKLKSPTILHFSTHGFSHPEQRGVHGNFWADTWTGLVLAGVNTYYRKNFDRIIQEAGTGELSSLAVCGMDLRNTKLVYLSTCVSSYGFYTAGEAVNSLAQAFRAAGASTVIATLWQILNEPARQFAVHFYFKVCQDGVCPSAALRYAKNMLREVDETQHHLLWSSFVCVGEDIPIFKGKK